MPVENSERETASGFRLLRYFTVTTFIALAVTGVALYQLERMEVAFFQKVQREQGKFFAQVQASFAKQQEEAARRNLLAVHEVGHVNLAQALSNLLWRSDLAAFVARVEALPVEPCRALAADARKACFAELGRRIQAMPNFAALDAKIRAAVRDSTVYKVKVYDLRGITAYSSQRSQIGEDQSGNAGWQRAVGGVPASELTHRDQFSTFERMVEDRDVISSYLPGRAPEGGPITGVFEIYSDVTPFVARIREAAAQQAKLGADHQARLQEAAAENAQKVASNVYVVVSVIGGLLAALYAVLFLIARRGQRLLDQQARAREESIRREQQWHREKMAALATMAANISHEVGNPLATIMLLAHEMKLFRDPPPKELPRMILLEAERIATMTRQISNFAAARSESTELLDFNYVVKSVCDFLSFDERCRATRIEFRPGEGLPACVAVPDHLNEALMTLLQACAENDPARSAVSSRLLAVETAASGDRVVVRIVGELPPDAGRDTQEGLRLSSARRRLEDMGGRLVRRGDTLEISLPAAKPA